MMTRSVLPRCVVLAAVATVVIVVAASCVQVAHGGRPKGFITRDDMEEFVEWFEEEGMCNKQSNSHKSLDLVATNSADKPTCTC